MFVYYIMSLPGSTRVYQGLPGSTRVYQGLPGSTRVYQGLPEKRTCVFVFGGTTPSGKRKRMSVFRGTHTNRRALCVRRVTPTPSGKRRSVFVFRGNKRFLTKITKNVVDPGRPW